MWFLLISSLLYFEFTYHILCTILKLISSIDYCVRALAIIGKGKDVESAFARVAIMPLLRSKLSLGRMDEGGSRGQCAGLFSMLDEISYEITRIYGPIIQKVSEEFSLSGENDDCADCPEIDLVTGGVWIPLAAAITGDTSIKMAIFSPGSPEVIQVRKVTAQKFIANKADVIIIFVRPTILPWTHLLSILLLDF